MNVSGGIVVLMSVLFSARAFGQSCTPSPQPSDFLPIANSVYGTLPRTVCGF